MYYSSNFVAFPMMSNFYMYNQNHGELDLNYSNSALHHHNPSFYYADGYRTIRVNNKLIDSDIHNRKIKINNSRSDLVFACPNGTFRRQNEIKMDTHCNRRPTNYKNGNTMTKNDKPEKVISLRSRSINTVLEKKDESYEGKPKADETCQIKQRSSRIDCFESEDKKKMTVEKQSKREEEKKEEQKAFRNLPPPPPPLPGDFNLLKINSNLTFNRGNKINNPSADANTTKSFDAVVDELKFRLNKIKPVNEEDVDDNLIKKIPKLILTERQISNETKTGFETLKEIDSGIQSTDTINKKLQTNSDSSISSATSQTKQNSLNRIKSVSRSNFGVNGVFRKNKLNFEQTNFYNDSNMNCLSESESKQSDNKTESSSMSDFTDSTKMESQNDCEEKCFNLPRSFTQNFNPKAKKVIFECIENCENSDKFSKKILKRNTFSEIKKSNLKQLDQTKSENKLQMNRLVKSKSEYINVNKDLLDRETQSSIDTFDLIKIESFGDLSNKQTCIAAFSTRNFFQNDKLKQDNSKIESSIKIDGEFKKNPFPIYASSTLKSKSEIKIKDKQKNVARPIAKSVFDNNTLKTNKFELCDNETVDIYKKPNKKQILNQIPSKYSSFVDLKKNKNQISHKRFNSLNRAMRTDLLCKNLISKACEYGIKLPELLGNFKQNNQFQQQELKKNENKKKYGIFNGINDFDNISFCDLDQNIMILNDI